MKRPYKVMVMQDDGYVQMYRTEDETIYKAIGAVTHIHTLQFPQKPFRITYIEEEIQNERN